MTIKWENSMAIGIEDIDNEHQEIFTILNNLFITKNDVNDVAKENLLEKLLNYSHRHFATEHKYFDKFNYPDIEKHEKDHQRYSNKVDKFFKLQKKNSLEIEEITDFITDWWLTHVMREDQDFKKYLIETNLI